MAGAYERAKQLLAEGTGSPEMLSKLQTKVDAHESKHASAEAGRGADVLGGDPDARVFGNAPAVDPAFEPVEPAVDPGADPNSYFPPDHGMFDDTYSYRDPKIQTGEGVTNYYARVEREWLEALLSFKKEGSAIIRADKAAPLGGEGVNQTLAHIQAQTRRVTEPLAAGIDEAVTLGAGREAGMFGAMRSPEMQASLEGIGRGDSAAEYRNLIAENPVTAGVGSVGGLIAGGAGNLAMRAGAGAAGKLGAKGLLGLGITGGVGAGIEATGREGVMQTSEGSFDPGALAAAGGTGAALGAATPFVMRGIGSGIEAVARQVGKNPGVALGLATGGIAGGAGALFTRKVLGKMIPESAKKKLTEAAVETASKLPGIGGIIAKGAATKKVTTATQKKVLDAYQDTPSFKPQVSNRGDAMPLAEFRKQYGDAKADSVVAGATTKGATAFVKVAPRSAHDMKNLTRLLDELGDEKLSSKAFESLTTVLKNNPELSKEIAELARAPGPRKAVVKQFLDNHPEFSTSSSSNITRLIMQMLSIHDKQQEANK